MEDSYNRVDIVNLVTMAVLHIREAANILTTVKPEVSDLMLKLDVGLMDEFKLTEDDMDEVKSISEELCS